MLLDGVRWEYELMLALDPRLLMPAAGGRRARRRMQLAVARAWAAGDVEIVSGAMPLVRELLAEDGRRWWSNRGLPRRSWPQPRARRRLPEGRREGSMRQGTPQCGDRLRTRIVGHAPNLRAP